MVPLPAFGTEKPAESELLLCASCGAHSGPGMKWIGALCPACLLLEGLENDEDEGEDHLEIARLATLLPEFEFHRMLGRGGSASVYLATELAADRAVAIKVLSPETAYLNKDRFLREAAILKKLDHPGIVRLEGWGEVQGMWYLLLEYVDGCSLRRIIRPGGMPAKDAVAVVLTIADALAAAHHAGLVHRDIKPENILVGLDGRPKLTDFGLARDMTGEIETLDSNSISGTPSYMAPERFTAGAVVDQRTDVFSLGVVLYELLTGDLPIGRFAAPSKRGAGGSRLDAVVFRALDPDPARRHHDARAFHTALASALLPNHRPKLLACILGFLAAGAILHGLQGGGYLFPRDAGNGIDDPIRRQFMKTVSDMESTAVDLVARDEPLRDVLARLNATTGMQYRLYPGVGDERVTCSFNAASLNQIHQALFSSFGLATAMRQGGVLFVYKVPPSSPARVREAEERRAHAAAMATGVVGTPVPGVFSTTFAFKQKATTVHAVLGEIGRQCGYHFVVPDGLCEETMDADFGGMPGDSGFQLILAKRGYGWKALPDGAIEVMRIAPEEAAFEVIGQDSAAIPAPH